jgi:hypothetical protein
MRRRHGAPAAILLLLLIVSPASGQSDEIDRVVPDTYFVHAECARLSALDVTSYELLQARNTVGEACSAYEKDHDGDRWFKASDRAREELDEFERDHTQHGLRFVRPRELVPPTATSYAVFLAPSSTTWATADLTALRSIFKQLGSAIGPENLAVWFEQPYEPGNIDSGRCRYYFDMFKLRALGKDPQGGPYVVTTSTRPDRWSKAEDTVIVDLAATSIDEATRKLARLVAAIRRESAVHGSALPQIAGRYRGAIATDAATFHGASVALVRGT